jgi:hypothetical protein
MYIGKVTNENEMEYGTILHFGIEFIYFKVFRCMYRVQRNVKLGKYEYCTILQFIIEIIHFTVS